MKITYIKDKMGWVCYAPSFPHVTAQGKTKKEARESLIEDIKVIEKIEGKSILKVNNRRINYS